ncbi:MAG: DPP IV N-terminal domain-containing protein, partial [Planctomycetota bacterium]
WIPGEAAWSRFETDNRGKRHLVRVDAKTGDRTVIASADDLTPQQGERPIAVSSYTWSADKSKLLLFTNTRRVWRANTRGDYWVLHLNAGPRPKFRKDAGDGANVGDSRSTSPDDLTASSGRTASSDTQTPGTRLQRIGRNRPPSSLMFAKFSPDGQRVAYVSERDLFLEDLKNGSVLQLTRRESDDIINGTFDWVYEEELSLRDGFAFSPDGTQLAYWQLDESGVPKYPLQRPGEGLYPTIQSFAYPKVGETNSASRIGVMRLPGKRFAGYRPNTVWADIPGDPRNHYLARMQWTPSAEDSVASSCLMVQQLNRRQNTNRIWKVQPGSGVARQVFVERDAAWVDARDDMFWFDNGKSFTWTSESSGWRQLLAVSNDGTMIRTITDQPYDVIDVLHVGDVTALDGGSESDSRVARSPASANRYIYFTACDDDPACRYLFRVPLIGGDAQRITPTNFRGSNAYQISDDGQFAIHNHSAWNQPATISLVRLADHSLVRTLESNETLRK